MTLELDSHYYNNLMASGKGRSASICASGLSAMESAAIAAAAASGGGSGRRQLPPLQNQNLNGGSRNNYNYHPGPSPNHPNYNYNTQVDDRQFVNRGSGGNMHIANTSAPSPTRNRKHGAHRSQSARVPGSQRPKIKRREQELQEQYEQQHLDCASSEGALRDCQESYNPFLNKTPSTGRLVTSTSLEMSQQSLQHQQSLPKFQNLELPKDSPHLRRRHSGGGYERRGSNAVNDHQALKDVVEMMGFANTGPMIIPTIATPGSSPQPVRRSTNQQQQPNNKSGSGLPKSPSNSRSPSQRRVNSVKSPSRREKYLDVPDSNQTSPEDEDEESYKLRSFSVTPKGGVVNRGDSMRRRRSRSNSLIPTPTTPDPHQSITAFTTDDGLLMPANASRANSRVNSRANSRRSSRCSPNQTPNQSPRPSIAPQPPSPTGPTSHYRVAIVGGRGVGKTALMSQFLTSDSINAYEGNDEMEGEETVSVMLDGEESEITFFKMDNPKTELNRLSAPDGFLLVYSVVDRASFQRAEAELRRLQEMDLLRTKAVVIVANKIDLARSRSISTQDGRCLAVANRVKFIEISVGINHNVDELLVGVVHQIRLKLELGTQENWLKHRGMLKASAKARQMLSWLVGKEDAKFKNCENLHIL